MENTAKMTQIDIYEKIKEIVSASEDADVATIVEFCDKKIAQAIDKREKAQAKAAEKKAESDEMTDAIAEILTEDGQTAEDIAQALLGRFEDITKAKVVARLTQLVNAGVVIKEQIKTEDGRKVMSYKLFDAESDAAEDTE